MIIIGKMKGLLTDLAAPHVGHPTDQRPRVEDFAGLPQTS
jgi:hypothetical protein